MRYLTILADDKVIDQIPTTLTDEQVIEIDELLRKNGLLEDHEELATTYDEDPVYFRPQGVPFLEEWPLVFWTNERGARRDFPGALVVGYTEAELKAYCQSKNLNPEEIKLYD